MDADQTNTDVPLCTGCVQARQRTAELERQNVQLQKRIEQLEKRLEELSRSGKRHVDKGVTLIYRPTADSLYAHALHPPTHRRGRITKGR
jgi:predicted RNase H-like nuclease (RuvC/YqgF family)